METLKRIILIALCLVVGQADAQFIVGTSGGGTISGGGSGLPYRIFTKLGDTSPANSVDDYIDNLSPERATSDTLYIGVDPIPSGYTVSIDDGGDGIISGAEVTSAGFTWASAVVGATYEYTFTSDAGGTPVSGSGTIATTTDNITGIDLSGLTDGTITLATYQWTSGGIGIIAQDQVTKGVGAAPDLFPTGNAASATSEANATTGFSGVGTLTSIVDPEDGAGGTGGDYAIRFEATLEGWRAAEISITGLTNGASYTAQIRHRYNDAQAGVFNWANVSGANYGTDDSSNTWYTRTVTFTATSTTVIARFYADSFGGGLNPGQAIEISEVTITEN